MTSIPFERLVAILGGRETTAGDVYALVRRSLTVRMEGGRIGELVESLDSGVGLRRAVGFAQASAALSNPSVPALIESATTLRGGCRRGRALTLRRVRPAWRQPRSVPPSRHPLAGKVRLVREMEGAVRAFDRRIREVLVQYRETEDTVTVASADATLALDRRTRLLFLVQVVAEGKGQVQSAREVVAVCGGVETLPCERLLAASLTAAGRAVMLLSADPAPQGAFPVVLSSAAGGTMVHEAIGHGLEADLAGRGLSAYSRRLGRRVAAETVTVVDDPTLSGRYGSYGFDDEGVPARRVVLVEKGVLRDFLYDRLSAARAGVQSNGHGRRDSYRVLPIPRMGNTLISPGTADPEDIISSVDDGIMVTKMGGGQVDTASGDFVFEVAEGYRITRGARGAPIRNATLVGNGPQVLEQVAAIGSDLGFGVGTCGKDGQGVPVGDAQPTLLVDRLVVGGRG